MPNNYAVVDEEEMTYVDGGSLKYVGYIDPSTCGKLAAICCIAGGIITIGCGVITIVSTCLGGGIAALGIGGGITTICAGITAAISGYFWLAGECNGMNVYYETITQTFTPVIVP